MQLFGRALTSPKRVPKPSFHSQLSVKLQAKKCVSRTPSATALQEQQQNTVMSLTVLLKTLGMAEQVPLPTHTCCPAALSTLVCRGKQVITCGVSQVTCTYMTYRCQHHAAA